jgi:ABC-type multidrug transport system fused ATPase/permease subunit
VIKRHELRVFAITALVNVTAFLLGPIVGVAFLFLTSSSLAVIDVIGSLVYAVVMPYAGIAIALLFYDLRRRHAEAPAVSPSAIVAPTASH